jgi:hypothetical protein
MKIDQTLNFVVPVETEDRGVVYVHAAPISPETFDVYWDVLGQTYSKIFGGGHGSAGGSRIAAKALRDIAKDQGVWEGPQGVEMNVIGEVRRLAHVIVPNEKAVVVEDEGKSPQWKATAWHSMGMDEAVKKGVLDKQDADEVENILVFFTVNSVMRRRKELAMLLEVGRKVGTLWDAHTTSLNSTAYRNSLPTLTAIASSGETAKGLSPPS